MKACVIAAGLLLLSVSASQAIDCMKAATDIERAICASPDAVAADTAMSAAYSAALKLSTPKDAKSLRADQLNWNDLRRDCATTVADDGTASHATPAAMAQCLTDGANARAAYLSGTPAAGPGTSDRLVPVVFFCIDDIFNHTLRFPKPANAGEKAFNAALDAELRNIHTATTESDNSDSFEMTLAYASAALISAGIEVYLDGPRYAHPMPYDVAINIDMRTGKRLTIADLLDPAQLKPLTFYCDTQFEPYIASDQDGADVRRDNVDNAVGNLDFWTFGKAAATVTYTEYGLDNPATCVIGYDLLRPRLKAGFPLPQ